MKILFGFGDVLTLDAWLAHFEEKGHDVDGAMSGEDLIGVAKSFQPDVLVCEYHLKGEIDGLGVFYELCSDPNTTHTKLILISDIKFSGGKKLNTKFVQSGGVLGVIRSSEVSFEAVEELI